MAKLIIIGNGFDLDHDLPSSYKYFEKYLLASKDNRFNKLGKTLNVLFNENDLWSDFEKTLGEPNEDKLRSIKKIFGEQIIDKSYAKQISLAFESWIRSFDDKDIKKKYNLNKQDYYLSFNYTFTLEGCYEIPSDKICHIHGYVAQTYFDDHKLIFGHSKVKSEGESKDFIDATYKDTKKILSDNMEFFNGLCNIDEIIVAGFSYSLIDMEYIKYLAKKFPNAYWKLAFHTENDLKAAKDFAISYLNDKTKYSVILYGEILK